TSRYTLSLHDALPIYQGQLQLVQASTGQGHADQTTALSRHEVDRLRGNHLGGHDEVPLVLAVLVVHDDDKLTLLDHFDCFTDCRSEEHTSELQSLAYL